MSDELIGPLTASEWCEFRRRDNDEDELIACCAETSAARDHIFYLLRQGFDSELDRKMYAPGFNRHVYWPLVVGHDVQGRGRELVEKMNDWFHAPEPKENPAG